MVGFWAFLTDTLLSGAVGAIFIAIGAYLGRSQLAHWLSKDLEAAKAGHQRELEAYRVSLVAEVERAKATQDLKRASALRMLEKRFNAVDAFHKASAGCASDILSSAQMLPEHKGVECWNGAYKRAMDLRDASLGMELFLTLEQQQDFLNYRKAVTALLPHCRMNAAKLEGPTFHALRTAVLAAELKTDAIVRGMTEEFQQLA